MKIRLVMGLVALALAVGGTGLLVSRAMAEEPKPVEFTLKDTDKKDVKLSSYRGKVVLVDIWATWCPPCRREIPELVALQKEIEKEKLPVQVLGISVDENPRVLPKFIKDYKINYPTLLADAKVLETLQFSNRVPTKVLIDHTGAIQGVRIGAMTKQQLTDWLAEPIQRAKVAAEKAAKEKAEKKSGAERGSRSGRGTRARAPFWCIMLKG